MVRDWDVRGSRVDWASIVHIVVERYAQRLELLARTLNNASYPDVRTRAAKARAQVLTMLAPHLTTTDVPRNTGTAAANSWLAPVVRRCATTHTAGIPIGLLTSQEHLIHDAVDEAMREICRRLGRMFRAAFDVEDSTWEDDELDGVVDIMNTEVTALMDWLDWTSLWLKCKPECSEEVCIVSHACVT